MHSAPPARPFGGIVALWHVPLIWVAGENLPPIFIPTTVAVTFFYSWLFLRSGGSVFLTILAHAVEGTVAPQFTKSSGFAGADRSTWILLYAAGWFAVAIALVLLDRQLWCPGNRRGRVEAVGTPLPTASPGLVS